MKQKHSYGLFSVIFFILACSATLQTVEEPIADKCLIIGSVLLDIDGYDDNLTTLSDNIEVAVLGKIIQNGQIKKVGFWTRTDENGLFILPNVPMGDYVIKGIRTHLIGVGDLVITNELIDSERNYYELNRHSFIGFTGNLFDIQISNRVANFKHNIFKLNRNGWIDFQRIDRLKQFKISTGERIDRQSVQFQFLDKFPESQWARFVETHITY
ncbi:MAG: hypothetical protein SCK70_03610 [bacterium]|nr:hypothetical protein [bacterium]